MRYFLYLLITTLALHLGSCKPADEPEDIVLGEPVFYAAGTVNGKAISLTAGKDNYVLETSNKWTNGLLNYVGTLSKTGCSNCGEALEITFRNYTPDSSTFSIDSLLMLTDYTYFDESLPFKTYYDVTFVGQSTGNGSATHNWVFADGFTTNRAAFTRRYTQPTSSEVTYSNQFTNNCSSSIVQGFKTPVSALFNNKFVEFNFSYTGNHTILVNSIPVQPNEMVQWVVNDSIVTQTGNIVQLGIDSLVPTRVCMLYPVAGDTPITHCKNIAPKAANNCLSNCKIKSSTIEDALQLATVEVRWRDATGKWYSSNQVKQPATAQFKLLEKQPYERNAKGEQTTKIKLNINCTVSDGTTNINLENITAVIAIAHN
ncbi:MAG: hypothetical protein EAY81_05760 [Bacteroidetes bacterium]|nr:MAG: hypothetical protein EAY81_05760 [Bacteroidota bacterium]